MKCPCCSGKDLEKCCAPYLRGEPPSSPLILMRTRYTAYALHYADYIIQTTHPYNPNQPTRESVMQFCITSKFQGLEIKDYDDTTVTFTAYINNSSFTEKSTFAQVDGKWLYLSGEIDPNPQK